MAGRDEQNSFWRAIAAGLSSEDAALEAGVSQPVELETVEEPPALLHPSMAHEYRKRINALYEALQDEETRPEAADIVRTLIDRIVLAPDDNGDKLEILVKGDIAGILDLAAHNKTPAKRGRDGRLVVPMVAGARNRRQQQGLFQAAA